MKKITNQLGKIYKMFGWGYYKWIKSIIGLFICSLAINLFIVPNNLYTGGVLGLAQLIRTVLVTSFNISVGFDLSSVIYYLINIPLFILAYKMVGKTFFVRTLYCVTLNAIFLAIIPIPEVALVPELMTNVLIGGMLGGFGIGLVLSTGGSTGGIDIIGIALSKKNRRYSVGNISLVFNVFVYGICGILYGVETMIYSIVYAVFDTLAIDRTHSQNICSEAFIFTKNKPDKMIEFIINILNRDATYWSAKGGYTNGSTYITYTVLNKYERMRLERHMKEFDTNAFMVSDDGVEIQGEFKKQM